MDNRINPVGLKGKKLINDRMLELMGINEAEVVKKPVHNVKLTKKGPDGKAYAIVTENNKYFIKIANIDKNGLVTENFQYIGGLENKLDEAYSSYSQATKKLQNKFNELGKRLGVSNTTNILKNDNLLSEGYGFAEGSGFAEDNGNQLPPPPDEIHYDVEKGGTPKDVYYGEVTEDDLFQIEELFDEEEFTPHGSYTVSNSGGYEVMLSDSGDAAKVRDAYGSDNPQTSDWLPIEYIADEDDPEGDMVAVIDPNGYNIPLNQVMRINNEDRGFGIDPSNIGETLKAVNALYESVMGKKKSLI